jgi:hypothetical protein
MALAIPHRVARRMPVVVLAGFENTVTVGIMIGEAPPPTG